MSLEIFSQNVKYLRQRKSLTQQQLADRLKTKRATIGAWEEARCYPSIDMLLVICDHFKVTERSILTSKLSDPTHTPAVRPGTDEAAKELGEALNKIIVTANEALNR